jgi:aspartyl-tRNA(Asn)/glutamyl-tRNA(Gln) amidotransferase subunit C
VRHLAKLSRLSLSPKEEKRIVKELDEILSYFRTIDEAKVGNINPIHHVRSIANAYRDDMVIPSFPEVTEGVPNKKGRFVKAPRVF